MIILKSTWEVGATLIRNEENKKGLEDLKRLAEERKLDRIRFGVITKESEMNQKVPQLYGFVIVTDAKEYDAALKACNSNLASIKRGQGKLFVEICEHIVDANMYNMPPALFLMNGIIVWCRWLFEKKVAEWEKKHFKKSGYKYEISDEERKQVWIRWKKYKGLLVSERQRMRKEKFEEEFRKKQWNWS